jgi:hypothetical protein
MATTSYRANVGQDASASYSSTAKIELVTENQNFVGAQGATIFCLSTQDGKLEINYIDLNGNSSLLHTEDCIADDLKVVDLSFRVPSFSVDFTPTAATAGTVTVGAYTY